MSSKKMFWLSLLGCLALSLLYLVVLGGVVVLLESLELGKECTLPHSPRVNLKVPYMQAGYLGYNMAKEGESWESVSNKLDAAWKIIYSNKLGIE